MSMCKLFSYVGNQNLINCGEVIEIWGKWYSTEYTTELNLHNNGLTGTLPPEIFELINLTYLNLSNNELTGSIPSEIGNLVNLTSLSLYSNQISGEIPTCVAEAQGIIFYGTKEDQTGAKKIGRLYRATLTVADDLYVLANQQLIKEWNIDSVTAQPMFLFTTRDSVHTGIKESASESYLWRYYLPTAGIARYYKLGAGSLVQGINKVNEQFIATVNGSGLHQQSATAFESEGYLITSPADFFTAEAKSSGPISEVGVFMRFLAKASASANFKTRSLFIFLGRTK